MIIRCSVLALLNQSNRQNQDTHMNHRDILPHSVSVRGIKQCCNTGCMITHDRDRNAAKNILAVFMNYVDKGERPQAFQRQNSKVKKTMESYSNMALNSYCPMCQSTFCGTLEEHMKTAHASSALEITAN